MTVVQELTTLDTAVERGAERLPREDEIGARASTEQRRAHSEQAGGRVHLIYGKVEGRPDEDVPEALDRRVRRAETPEHIAECLARPCLRAATPQGGQRDAHAVAKRNVCVTHQRPETRFDLCTPSLLVDHRQYQRTPLVRGALADPVEEGQVLREAPERDVLPVVGRRRGIALAFGQRLHCATERRPRLVQRHLVARVDKIERSRQPGEAAADDCGPHRRRPSPTIRSFVSVESCGGPSKTSKPRASIRSSVAR